MTEDKDKNPYIDMPQDVLTKHLEQLSTVIKDKKVDVTQYFGAPPSEEDLNKIKEFEPLTAKVKELTDASSVKDLSDNETILSQASIDRIVSDIKKIDADAPLAAVLESKFNNLDKLSILGSVQGMVEHYTGQITTIKKELGGSKAGEGTGTQTFGKPGSTDETAESIITEMTKSGKKE